MSEKLEPMLASLIENRIPKLTNYLPDIIKYLKKYAILDEDGLKTILDQRGSVKEKTRAVWNIVSKQVLSDWSKYWKLVQVLQRSNLPSVAHDMLPSHYRPDGETQLLNSDDLDTMLDSKVIADKDNYHWVTGNRDFSELVQSLEKAISLSQKKDVLEQFISKMDSLKSIHPADDDDEDPSKRPAIPLDPSKRPVIPLDPSKSKSARNTALIVTLIVITIVVILIAVIAVGVTVAYNSNTHAGGNRQTDPSPKGHHPSYGYSVPYLDHSR